MGVEPTAARSARPATGFEDREAHRDSYTPTKNIAYPRQGCYWFFAVETENRQPPLDDPAPVLAKEPVPVPRADQAFVATPPRDS
jgi:hypothetical protein